MEIKLTPQESEKYFLNSLCNSLGEFNGYGFELDFDAKQYTEAKAKLKKDVPNVWHCFEDILMQLLRDGGSLTMVDVEGEGDGNSTINLQDVHERVQKTQLNHLFHMINETDDATTGDVILQTVFFGSIIYG